jgi:NADH:ubiquinone oxidoreductase subunit
MNIGTLIFTWFNGDLIGTDEFGNRYYRSKSKKRWGREQRWCLFKGAKDSTKVPAEWHAWLHHTVEEPLTQMSAEPHAWQKPHEANPTGTVAAYRPAGHAFKGGKRASATGDYEAWAPE